MSSTLWYLYEFMRKKWIKNFTCAKTTEDILKAPRRFRRIPPTIEYPERCISCGACASSCLPFAIVLEYNEEYDKKIPVIDEGSCISCGNCVESCPTKVLEIGSLREDTLGLPWNVPKYLNYIIDEEFCVNCGKCKRVCPVGAISENEHYHIIDMNRCIGCDRCTEECPVIGAIKTFDEKELSEKFNISQEYRVKLLSMSEEDRKKLKEELLKKRLEKMDKCNGDNKDVSTNNGNNFDNNPNNNFNNKNKNNKNNIINNNNNNNSNNNKTNAADKNIENTDTNDNLDNLKNSINFEIPRIVKSLCIKCTNCIDVCVGEIDLENYKVLDCVGCYKCIEVCPTTSIRIGAVNIVPKITDKCYIVDEDVCIGCRICYKVCEVDGAIRISSETKLPYINPGLCVRCGLCYEECPVDAIELDNTKKAMDRYIERIISDKLVELIERDMTEYIDKYISLKRDATKSLDNKLKNK